MGPEPISPATAGKTEMVASEVVAAKAVESAVPAVVEPALPAVAQATPVPDEIKASFGASLRAIAERYIKEGDELFRYEPETLKSDEYAKASLWEKCQTLAPVVAQKFATAVSVIGGGLTAAFGLTSIVALASGEPGVAIATAIMSTGFGFITNALWNSSRDLVSEMKDADKGQVTATPADPGATAVKI